MNPELTISQLQMPSFVCSRTKLLIFAIQESQLGPDASGQGLFFR